MDRRSFLLTPAVAAGVMQTRTRLATTDPNKRVYALNRNWEYSPNKTKWERVTLPHSNVRLPWHSFDEKDFQFVSSYRRHFQAPAGWKGKRLRRLRRCDDRRQSVDQRP